jgi:chromosome segregation ATPase
MDSRISAAKDPLLAKLEGMQTQLDAERSEAARNCHCAQNQHEAAAKRAADLDEQVMQLRKEVARSKEELQRYCSLHLYGLYFLLLLLLLHLA